MEAIMYTRPMPYDGISLRSGTDCLNLTRLHNPYAIPITERLGEKVTLSPTSSPTKFPYALQTVIAEHEEVGPENVLVANGRHAILHPLFASLAPLQVMLIGPVPQEYHAILDQQQIPFLQLPLNPDDSQGLSSQALQKLRETRADLAILSTPNEFTGSTMSGLQAIFSIIRAPRILVDASLQEFLYPVSTYYEQRYLTCLHSLRPGTTLFMVKDFSSFFSCPGICLACLLGDKHPLGNIQREAPPYTTPIASQAMGELLFQHLDEYRATLPHLTDDVTTTAISIRRSPLFIPDYVFEGPSFVYAGLSLPNRQKEITQILQKHRIRLTSTSPATGLPAGFFRISALNGEALAYLEQIFTLIADEIFE